MIEIEPHLGGHSNITNVDRALLQFIKEKFGVKSMLDIGCGPGGMFSRAKENNIMWQGIDGDPNIINENIILHDFTKGKVDLEKIRKFDLAWSTEFLEHVEEKYLDNFMPLFSLANLAVITAALPEDTGGHHHVNLQPPEYWIDQFEKYGFTYDAETTAKAKQISKMRKGFFKRNGLIFTK